MLNAAVRSPLTVGDNSATGYQFGLPVHMFVREDEATKKELLDELTTSAFTDPSGHATVATLYQCEMAIMKMLLKPQQCQSLQTDGDRDIQMYDRCSDLSNKDEMVQWKNRSCTNSGQSCLWFRFLMLDGSNEGQMFMDKPASSFLEKILALWLRLPRGTCTASVAFSGISLTTIKCKGGAARL